MLQPVASTDATAAVVAMSHREIALEYLRRFCAGDIDATAELMAQGLQFAAPRAPAGSRISSADAGRAEPGSYRVINVIEDDQGDVTVLYDYERPNRALTIAQWFRFDGQRIVETNLVFDTKGRHDDWSTLFRRGTRCGLTGKRDRPTRCLE